MKKLNNKGMTIVEILVCFMIVAFISTALFSTVTTFNNKRTIESSKAELIQYRNDIDKLIEDDLIHRGLTNADVNVVTAKDASNNLISKVTYTVKMYFRDGTTRTLTIYSQRAGEYGSSTSEAGTCTGFNDSFYIKYDGIKYPLPDVGESVNTACTPNETIKDLRFNTIKVSKEDNVLLIYVNFYHPELGSDYSINIVAPMNYFA